MKPYLVVSDIHAHAWTIFSTTDKDGVNSRLRLILNELDRAVETLTDAGGDTMVIAGDLMHSRGVIDPEVLNPVRACFEDIMARGVTIHAIPGNHDLKSAETVDLASSIQNLEQIGAFGGAFSIYNEVTLVGDEGQGIPHMLFVPWHNTQEGLLKALKDAADSMGPQLAAKADVFIHAGIDGVLNGMPGHGLTHTRLAGYGFKRVFAGHYHNHKDFGNGVISVGATTHHHWGDVGTKAGFLLVDDAKVSYHASEAPAFIDISGMDEMQMQMICPGNYVRYRGAAMTGEQVEELRRELRFMGAQGVSIEVPRVNTTVRASTPRASGMTTEQSIEAFVTATPPVSTRVTAEEVTRRAIAVLQESQAVSS